MFTCIPASDFTSEGFSINGLADTAAFPDATDRAGVVRGEKSSRTSDVGNCGVRRVAIRGLGRGRFSVDAEGVIIPTTSDGRSLVSAPLSHADGSHWSGNGEVDEQSSPVERRTHRSVTPDLSSAACSDDEAGRPNRSDGNVAGRAGSMSPSPPSASHSCQSPNPVTGASARTVAPPSVGVLGSMGLYDM